MPVWRPGPPAWLAGRPHRSREMWPRTRASWLSSSSHPGLAGSSGRRPDRAALARVIGAWRQLERFMGLHLPADATRASWIRWLEVRGRAPHNRKVSQFLEDLLAPWPETLAAIVELGVEEGVFATPPSVDDGPEVTRALSADLRVGLSVRSAGTD